MRQSSTVSLENLAVRLAIEAGVGALGLTRLSSLGLGIIDHRLSIRYSGQTTTMPPTRRRTQLHAQLGIPPTVGVIEFAASIIEALVRIQAMARRYAARRLYRSLRFTVRMNEYLGRSGGAVPGRVRVGVDRPYPHPGGFYEVRGRTGRDEYTGDQQVHMIDPTTPAAEAWNALDVQGSLTWNPPEGMARNRAYRGPSYPIRRRHSSGFPYRI